MRRTKGRVISEKENGVEKALEVAHLKAHVRNNTILGSMRRNSLNAKAGRTTDGPEERFEGHTKEFGKLVQVQRKRVMW